MHSLSAVITGWKRCLMCAIYIWQQTPQVSQGSWDRCFNHFHSLESTQYKKLNGHQTHAQREYMQSSHVFGAALYTARHEHTSPAWSNGEWGDFLELGNVYAHTYTHVRARIMMLELVDVIHMCIHVHVYMYEDLGVPWACECPTAFQAYFVSRE